MTSSIVLCPNFWTSAAKVRSRAPKKASTAWRSDASSSRGWSLLASFSALPVSSTMSLDPFFRFLSAAQASSLTDPMPRRVSRASFVSSQVASSSKLKRMLEPVAPMRSWHQVILLVSSLLLRAETVGPALPTSRTGRVGGGRTSASRL